MKLTWIDLNTWMFEFGDYTILVDPWLVDPLIFYGMPWLFTAQHTVPPAYTPETLPTIDLILISQGLDDHCHKPTLERLSRTIPVVASPTAAKVARALGFQQVTALGHWQHYDVAERFQITAIPGAEIQPGQTENGYWLADHRTGATLYYEPHQFPATANLGERLGSVDVAIAPIVGQIFPLLGQVIMGPTEALQLVNTLQPRWYLPTTMGDIQASGLLPRLTQSVGSIAEFSDRLAQSGQTTQFILPEPGRPLELTVTHQ